MKSPSLTKILSSLIFAIILALPVCASTQNIDKQEDERKARIWHAAISWIYNDNNVRSEQKNDLPELSFGTTEEFETSLKSANEKGLEKYNFYKHIYKKVSDKASTDHELVNLITEAANKKGRDTESLKKELERVAGIAEEIATLDKEQESTSIDNSTPSREVTDAQLVSEAETTPIIYDNKSHTGFPFYSGITALALGGLSFILSIICVYLVSNHKSEVRRRLNDRPYREITSVYNQSSSASDIERTLNREIQTVERKLKELELVLGNRISAIETSNRSSTKTEMQNNFQPASQARPQNKPLESLKKYAHLPEDGLIRDRDVLDYNAPNAYIELTFPNNNSEFLNFRINPDSTHKLAINNSQERLKAFFEIHQNSNEVSRIVNTGDGKLLKTPQGWKMDTKAKVRFE